MKALLKLSTLKGLAVFACLSGSFGVGYWYGKIDPSPIDPVLVGYAPHLDPVPAATAAPDDGAKTPGGPHPAHE